MRKITLTQKCLNLEVQLKRVFDERKAVEQELIQVQHKLNDMTLRFETADQLHKTLLMQYNLRMDSIINLAKSRF